MMFMHGGMEAGSHDGQTGRKTVVRAGRMCFPASMTSFLGARTVPPATGYILSASCTHQRIAESFATMCTSAENLSHDAGRSESMHSFIDVNNKFTAVLLGGFSTLSIVTRHTAFGTKEHLPL